MITLTCLHAHVYIHIEYIHIEPSTHGLTIMLSKYKSIDPQFDPQ